MPSGDSEYPPVSKHLLRRRLLERIEPRDKESRASDPPRPSEEIVRMCFDPLDIEWEAEANRLRVFFPHRFFGARFADLFQADFEETARGIFGEDLAFAYSVANAGALSGGGARWLERKEPAEFRGGGLAGSAGAARPHPALINPFPFGEERTFDTFIANGKHKWALTLARDLARRAAHGTGGGNGKKDGEEDGETPGLLVLCGGHGTGKTHLIHAVGNELFRTLGRDLRLLSADDLTERFVTAPGAAARVALRRELADARALLVDDAQRLSAGAGGQTGHTAHLANELQADDLQNELCLILDRFLEQGKAVMFAGVGHPRDWRLAAGLFSRLETGLWAELPEPDLDVRLRYAQQQARACRTPLHRETLLVLAQHCPDIRRLSGLLRRAAAHRALLGRELSEQDILTILKQGADTSPLTPQLIISIVGERCGIPTREILGEKRRPDLVQARQLAMYLCRELLGHSYPVIGKIFGGKDHSTVMHGVKKIKQLQDTDRLVHSMVTELTRACRKRSG